MRPGPNRLHSPALPRILLISKPIHPNFRGCPESDRLLAWHIGTWWSSPHRSWAWGPRPKRPASDRSATAGRRAELKHAPGIAFAWPRRELTGSEHAVW